MRLTIRALILANEFLEHELQATASHGYTRGVRHGRVFGLAATTAGASRVNALKHYLEHFVEPTYEDFGHKPASERHAFLACVTAYHAIDRAAYPKRPRNLRDQWIKECPQFAIVDMVAHHFKHVRSDAEKRREQFRLLTQSLLLVRSTPLRLMKSPLTKVGWTFGTYFLLSAK